MKLVVVCTDVLFRAKLRDAAARAGAEVVAVASPDEARSRGADSSLAVVDLGESRADPLACIAALRGAAGPSLRVLGFASHVRVDQLDAGRALCDEVAPRSRAVEALSALLAAGGSAPA